jgi:arylsulfatase A-like enzyme
MSFPSHTGLSRVILSTLGLTLATLTSGAAAPRPNVLMIVVDDMNDWIGALGGHPQVQTPHLDRLAERGLLFTNAHVPAPVCNPSRVAVMTGLNPSTTGIYDNSVRWHENLPGVVSLPQYFKSHGYRVVGGGKVHHHTPGNNRTTDWHDYFPQVFDSHAQTHLWTTGSWRGFAWPEGFPLNDLPSVKQLDRPPANPREFDWGPCDRDDMEMGDGQMVAWMEDFLAAPGEDPFLAIAGIYMPHLPWYAPRKYFDLYDRDTLQAPPVLENDLADIPAIGLQMAADRREDLELVRAAGKFQDVLHAYLACISYADALVGRLLDAVDANGLAENTIIVLWSDHGWHFGEKNHLHKFTLWERSTRIPMMVVAPGVTRAGSTTSAPVGAIDLFATLTDLVGLPAHAAQDGRSLLPLLQDGERPWPHPVLTTHGQGNHSLRSRHWRYIRYGDGGEELYDHRRDPNEWHNLARDPAYRDVMAVLAEHLPAHDAPRQTARRGPATANP